MANENSLVVFDRYSPEAQRAVAMLAAFSIVERAILKRTNEQPTFNDWDEVVRAAEDTGITNESGQPALVYRYLLRPDWRRPRTRDDKYILLRRDALKPRVRLAECLSKLLHLHYFKPGRPLHKELKSKKKDTKEGRLLAHLEKVAEDASWFSDHLERGSLNKFLDELVPGRGDIPNPDFPGCPLVCELSVACEFHDLARSGPMHRDDRSGLFVVVREARGWTVEQDRENETNMIVRDLLWISDLTAVVDGGGREVHGLYFSAYDKKSFDVTAKSDAAHAREKRNVLVAANPSDTIYADQQFELFFPIAAGEGRPIMRDGLIAGTARMVNQFGAWKALVVEPDWAEARRLETLIHVLHAKSTMGKILPGVLMGGGYCGTLYHAHARTSDPEYHARRDVFRRLVLGTSRTRNTKRAYATFLRREVDDVLHEHLRATLTQFATKSPAEAEAESKAVARKLLVTLEKVVEERWHLIEPAQIFTFVSNDMRGCSNEQEYGRLVRALLARDNLEPCDSSGSPDDDDVPQLAGATGST